MSGPLVRSVILSGASSIIRDAGRKPVAIARKAGLPAEALTDPDLLVSGRAVIAFFEMASAICGRRNFGLELAVGARLGAIIGPLWLLLRNAQTVRQMCEDFAKHFELYSSSAVMSFEPMGKGGTLNWSAATGEALSEVQMSEYALATTLEEIRSHGPRAWTPPAVWFRHEAPSDLHLHRKMFGPNLRFNSDRNAIELDAVILDRPLGSSGTRTRALVLQMLRHDEGLLSDTTAYQVQGIVRALLPYGQCSVGDVSLAMGLSVRTLQERLQETGDSFRAIKNAARADLADKYIKHSEMSATQIASLLGYTDSTSLSRAYRRWHGASLRSNRRRRVRTSNGSI